MRKSVALSLVLLLAHPMFGAAPEVITTSWGSLRGRLGNEKFTGKRFVLQLKDGKEVKATLLRIEDDAFVVTSSRATKEWAAAKGEARIPRERLAFVRQTGRTGRRGLIGGLVGLAAGGAIGAGVASGDVNPDFSPEAAGTVIGALAGAVLGVVGLLVGHYLDKPYPEFRIEE